MIKLVAFDMDGTFLRSDNTYGVERFEKIYRALQEKDIKVVVISGNQYAQLASFFPKYQDNFLHIILVFPCIHECLLSYDIHLQVVINP